MNLKALSREELESQYERLSAEFLKLEQLAGEAITAYSVAKSYLNTIHRAEAAIDRGLASQSQIRRIKRA